MVNNTKRGKLREKNQENVGGCGGISVCVGGRETENTGERVQLRETAIKQGENERSEEVVSKGEKPGSGEG